MDELAKAAYAGSFALVVYVLGKLLERAWLEPVLDARKVIGDIAFALVYYDNVSALTARAFQRDHPEQAQAILAEAHEGRKYLRERAGHLKSRAYAVPSTGYWFAVRMRLLPPISQIERAVTNLIGYSEGIAASNFPDFHNEHDRRKREITEALDLERTWGARTRSTTARPWPRRLRLPPPPWRRSTSG